MPNMFTVRQREDGTFEQASQKALTQRPVSPSSDVPNHSWLSQKQIKQVLGYAHDTGILPDPTSASEA